MKTGCKELILQCSPQYFSAKLIGTGDNRLGAVANCKVIDLFSTYFTSGHLLAKAKCEVSFDQNICLQGKFQTANAFALRDQCVMRLKA